jgi:hypothetical protein
MHVSSFLQRRIRRCRLNEAKIENFLAKKVVDNPNELRRRTPGDGLSGKTNKRQLPLLQPNVKLRMLLRS